MTDAPLIYFDANAFMYGFEGAPTVAEPVQALLAELQRRPGCGVTSELVLAELLAPVEREGALPVEIRRTLYLNLLVAGRMFSLRPVTRDILIETASLRRSIRLKLPDAVHMVTAVQAGCRFFLSNDRDVRQTPPSLRAVKPDAAGVTTILAELP